jgi:hypothetical protein
MILDAVAGRMKNTLIRLVFTHLRYRHRLIIPKAAHISSQMFIVPSRVAFPIHTSRSTKDSAYVPALCLASVVHCFFQTLIQLVS